MSKLDRLITELCQNDVEHKPLGEIGEFVRGKKKQYEYYRDKLLTFNETAV